MKRKIYTIIILALLLVAFKRAPVVGHILAQPGDSYFMLCANGHWEPEIYGADSIRPVCVGNEVGE